MANHQELKMYFSPDIVKKFAELEQNDKNFRVAEVMDRILLQETADFKRPILAAELGGGAHPDRYHGFFGRLLEAPRGCIDWVDISPYMLEMAKQYLADKRYRDRLGVIRFIESDIADYLLTLKDGTLDLAIMKYTIDHINDLEPLFGLLAAKLRPGGRLVSNISFDPELKSFSTNARYLYNGEQFPDNETRTLQDGDSFTIRFFKVSGDPVQGYLEGAETVKYFHSAERIVSLSKKLDFDLFLGDWKRLVPPESQGQESMDQDVLVLTKK